MFRGDKMEGQKKVLNDLLVEVFNHILSIEGANLKIGRAHV